MRGSLQFEFNLELNCVFLHKDSWDFSRRCNESIDQFMNKLFKFEESLELFF